MTDQAVGVDGSGHLVDSHANERVLTPARRAFGVAGVLIGDLLSAGLALIPLMGLWLIVLQLKANTIGPDVQVLDADEPAGTFSVVWLVLLVLALVPALVANATTRSWTGWSRRARMLVALPIVLAPAVASIISNDVWNALIHPW